MITYRNRYLGLSVDFPDTWKLISWRHTKIARSWKSAYQSKDDDFPKAGSKASKFLFTAALHPPKSDVVIKADIEISVFGLNRGEDMRNEMLANFERTCPSYESNGISKSIVREGIWTLGGIDFAYIDERSQSSSGESRYRFVFRRLRGPFWLYAKIAGHDVEAYGEALKIVEGLRLDFAAFDPARQLMARMKRNSADGGGKHEV